MLGSAVVAVFRTVKKKGSLVVETGIQDLCDISSFGGIVTGNSLLVTSAADSFLKL